MASILSVFTIGKAMDESGCPIDVKLEYSADLNRSMDSLFASYPTDAGLSTDIYSHSNVRSSHGLQELMNWFMSRQRVRCRQNSLVVMLYNNRHCVSVANRLNLSTFKSFMDCVIQKVTYMR